MKTLIANTADVAAHHIWRKAEATGAGTWVEIGGRHYGSM